MSLYTSSHRLWIWLLILTLQGCTLLPSPKPELKQVPLLPPAAMTQSWQKLQSVSLYREAQTESILTALVAWSVDPAQVKVAVLTPTGQSLLTLLYDGQTLEQDYSPAVAPRLRSAFSARTLVTQLQLAYWPKDVINRSLRHSEWQWLVEAESRRLMWRGQTQLEIEGAPERHQTFQIHHYAGDIRLEVKTLAHTPLQPGAQRQLP
jgi:uncharacterized protein YfaP (DUF2135 family)